MFTANKKKTTQDSNTLVLQGLGVLVIKSLLDVLRPASSWGLNGACGYFSITYVL